MPSWIAKPSGSAAARPINPPIEIPITSTSIVSSGSSEGQRLSTRVVTKSTMLLMFDPNVYEIGKNDSRGAPVSSAIRSASRAAIDGAARYPASTTTGRSSVTASASRRRCHSSSTVARSIGNAGFSTHTHAHPNQVVLTSPSSVIRVRRPAVCSAGRRPPGRTPAVPFCPPSFMRFLRTRIVRSPRRYDLRRRRTPAFAPSPLIG